MFITSLEGENPVNGKINVAFDEVEPIQRTFHPKVYFGTRSGRLVTTIQNILRINLKKLQLGDKNMSFHLKCKLQIRQMYQVLNFNPTIERTFTIKILSTEFI